MPNSKPVPEKGAVAVVEQPAPLGHYVEIWAPYFPLALTMLGWFVVSRQHNQRERRKEVRELVRLVEQRVDDILDQAAEYYSLDGKDPKCPALASKMRFGLSAIGQLLKRLRAAGLEPAANDELIAFRQAVTGGNFETVARQRQDSGGAVLAESSASGFALVSKLEENYFSAFPVRMKPLWQFWAR